MQLDTMVLPFTNKNKGHFLFWGILFSLTLNSCQVTHLASVSGSSTRVEASAAPSEQGDMQALLAPYQDKLQAEMQEEVGHFAERLEKEKLGYWFTDVMLEEADQRSTQWVDLAVMNSGGIRIGALEKGAVQKRKIFELMPFENGLIVLNVPGDTLQLLFDSMAEGGGWPVSRGTSYEIKDNKAAQIMINEQPLDKSRWYRLAISDYVADGGDGCHFLIPLKREKLGVSIREALFSYFSRKRDAKIAAPQTVRVKSMEP
ncbi:MAG: 5'-nucleotidase C-terminal domain-containing protein [Saprospiraceae bacterium]|nr:5'-nucleotidase C-terminal domain-containing protein [Saprospiraceae bacterium]